MVNDPLTLLDPLGGTPSNYDPYLVGCFPRFDFMMGFGCGWDEDSPCPPGYMPI